MTTSELPQLIVYSADSAFLEGLKPFSRGLSYVNCETGTGPQVTAKARLDALWATPMAGIELFGATPPFPMFEARVHETPAAQLRRGMPKYGVVGVTVPTGERRTPEGDLRLIISALLKAVRNFNSRSKEKIKRIGILPDDLQLKKLDPGTVFAIIREIYQEQNRTAGT